MARRRSAPTCRRRRSSTSIERRDTGIVGATINPTTQLQLTTSFKTQKHVGELPWGASFGFSNDVEVALPYTSRTNDFNLGAEWNNQRNMVRVAYDGSWFNNNDDTLVWDSPLRVDDSSSDGPGRGRMSLWPTNQAQTFSVAGSSKLARRTQITGFVSYGLWSNDSTLQPFTINSQLPVIALPRADRGSRGSRLLHQHRDRVAARGRLARDGAAAHLQLRQPDARHDDHRLRQLRLDRSTPRIPMGPLCTPTRAAPSRRMRRGPA